MTLDQNLIDVQVKLKVAEVESNIQFLCSLGRIDELARLAEIIQRRLMGTEYVQVNPIGTYSLDKGFVTNPYYQYHANPNYVMAPELHILFDEIKAGNSNRLLLTKQRLIEVITRQGYIFYTNNNKEEIVIRRSFNGFDVYISSNGKLECNIITYTSVVEAIDKFLELLSKKEETAPELQPLKTESVPVPRFSFDDVKD